MKNNFRKYLYGVVMGEIKGFLPFFLYSILYLMSLLFYIIVKSRRFFYSIGIFKGVDLKIPVISVGNLTWGGTGKTPLVQYISAYFIKRSKKIGLLIRGYGEDEDKMLAHNLQGLSVITGRCRSANAKKAMKKQKFDFFILDDGFQHLKIKRDIDIVTISAVSPFGRGSLIPAGSLREPVSALKYASVVVITKSDLIDVSCLEKLKRRVLGYNPKLIVFEAVHKPVDFIKFDGFSVAIDEMRGKRVFSLSALGDNDSFIKTLEGLGLIVEKSFSYMDHYKYSFSDMEGIIRSFNSSKADVIVTTQKDFFRIRPVVGDFPDTKIYVLRVELEVKNEEAFFNRLSDIISG
ncbi:MAG: tetraacyldisaccharide 4'-kinase [Candidatus Omnitrophota bacterium]